MLNDEITGLADNIRSRTGYKEKMTVPEMKDHVKDLSWVNHNLLSGTSDQYRTLTVDSSSSFMCKSTASSTYNYIYGAKPGDWYTYSATISNYSSTPISLELWLFKDGSDCKEDTENPYPINSHSEVVNPGEYDKDVSGYIQVGKTSNQIRTYIIVSNGRGVIGEQVQVKNERLYKGRQPGVWTPNSIDSTTSNGNLTASTLDRLLSSFDYHSLDVARGTSNSYAQSHLINYNSNAQAYRFNFSSTKDWNLQVYPSNNHIKNIPAGERVKQEVIITTDATQIKKAGFDFYYDGQSHVYQATVEQIALNTYRLTACWEAEATVNLYMYNLYHLDLKNASYLDIGVCHSWIYTGQSIGWELSPVMNLLYDTDNMADDSVWTNVGDVSQSSIKVQGSNNKIGTYYFSVTGTGNNTGRAQPIYLQNGVDYTISAYVQTDNDAKVALLLDNTTPYLLDPVGGSIERAVVTYDYTTDPYFDLKGNPNKDHFRRIGYHFNVHKDGYVAPRVVINSLNNGATSTTVRYGGLQLSINHDVPPYYTSQAGEKLCDMTGKNILTDSRTLKDWIIYTGGQSNIGVSVLNKGDFSIARLTKAWQEIYQNTDALLRGTRYTYSYNIFNTVPINYYLRNAADNAFLDNIVRADGKISHSDMNIIDNSIDNTIVDTADSELPFTFGYGIDNTTWDNNTAYIKLPTNRIRGEILPQDTSNSQVMYATLTNGQTYTQTIWIETDCNVNLDGDLTVTWFSMGEGHVSSSTKVIRLDAVNYKVVSTYTPSNRTDCVIRLFDIRGYDYVFDMFSSGTYFCIKRCKLQYGDRSTDSTPLDNAKRKSMTFVNNSIKGTNSSYFFGTQTKSPNTPTVAYFYLPKLEIGHKPTSWTKGGGGDLDVTF